MLHRQILALWFFEPRKVQTGYYPQRNSRTGETTVPVKTVKANLTQGTQGGHLKAASQGYTE